MTDRLITNLYETVRHPLREYELIVNLVCDQEFPERLA
jgi:hypothetical protein